MYNNKTSISTNTKMRKLKKIFFFPEKKWMIEFTLQIRGKWAWPVAAVA